MKTKINFKTKIVLIQAVSLFFTLFLTVVNSEVILADNLSYNNPQITPAKILSLTNKARKEKGLPALVVNQKLVSAAEAKAGDMFRYQYFEHNSPSGATPWSWIKAAGYDYHYAGENLAIDFVTAERAHKALMASDSHRENILNQKYTEIGISVKKDIFEKSESIIIVMEFGTPLKVKAVHTDSDKIDTEIKVVAGVELDNNKNNVNNAKKKSENKIINLQPSVVPLNIGTDIKKDNHQEAEKNIKRQENKKNKNNQNSKKIANRVRMIKLVGVSAESIKKNKLKKVYAEDIYWKSYREKNINRQAIVMSSGKQNRRGGFNLNVFFVSVALVLFAFESSYLFSNFVIAGKLKAESIRSGES
ncbi:MAG: CAP domain-containing protein [Patescibacteria group bacterium]|nr:CAP domain-containing protein [Patescibacteria group bacterium]